MQGLSSDSRDGCRAEHFALHCFSDSSSTAESKSTQNNLQGSSDHRSVTAAFSSTETRRESEPSDLIVVVH